METSCEKFNNLLNVEINAGLRMLTQGEYFMIVLMYLIQNRPLEARFAVLRCMDCHTGSPGLFSLAQIAEHLCMGNVTMAFAQTVNLNLHASYNPFIEELKKRLQARILKSIQRAYATIKLEDIALKLGQAPDESIVKLLTQFEWKIDQDGFVEPVDSSAFQNFISNAQDVAEFGADAATQTTENKLSMSNAEILRKLMSVM